MQQKNEFGCALMKENKVVAYASQWPKPYEENYSTHDLN